MRLAALTLENYGPFRRQHLLLDPAPGRLNLLVAPNGAGKSVLRRAFGDLLFDIPERSPMSWQYGTQNMRIIARLHDAAGELELTRRSGRGNTLSDANGPVPPELVRRLLGSADRPLFKDLFALDSHLLREGGLQLSRSSGRLGAMLLAGSGGLGRVQHLLDRLMEARDAIGRAERRHESKPLWKARKEAIEAGRALAQAALRPEAYLALEKRAADTATELQTLRAERDAVATALGRLTALRAVRPWLDRRRDALAALADSDDVPRLEPGFEARWRRAVEDHVRAAAAAAERARQAEDAEAALAAPPPDTALLDAAEQVEAILRDAVTALNAASHLPGVEAHYRQAGLEAARLRRELGWDEAVPVPAVPALRPARELLARRAGLVEAAEAAGRELATARRRVEQAQADLDGLPPEEDTAALSGLLRDIRAAGDPARRLETARLARRDAEAALASALAALPERALTRQQLAQTRAPAEATLTACEQVLTEAEAAYRDSLNARHKLARQQAEEQVALQRLMRDAALPEPGALAAARAGRDLLWDAVQAGDAAAAPRFEQALRQADAVADTLIAHAAQAAEAAARRRRIDDLTVQHPQAEGECAAASDVLRQARDRLAALAEAAGAPSAALPAALRGFLAARATALGAAVTLDRTSAEEADVSAALEQAGQRLAALGVAGDSLAAQLEAAEHRIAAAREAEAARKAVLSDGRKAGRDLQERLAAEARARQALAQWQAAWRDAIGALARPADETPEATGTALDLVDQLRGQQAAAAAAEVRIRDMRAAIDGFAVGIAALCARAAPDLAALAPQEAASQLQKRLRGQREAAARQERDLRNRDAARQAALRADEAARAASNELAAQRAALRADSNAAAETQLRRIAAVAEAEAALGDARRHILAQAGGRADGELEALAASTTDAEDAADIDRLKARQAELAGKLENASAEARSAAEALERGSTGEDAVTAAARREAALTALARHAEEALVLHAAASLLRAALEAERVESGAGTVARIGAAFRALTGGAYAGVAVEDRGNEQVMVALEAAGNGRKDIGDGLSEGTSDQLFLALRLVALEDYVAGQPPLPFIADDVLQTFDDARAVAALRALLDLSVHVQVIVLTHHPHVRALADCLPAGTVHEVVLSELAEAA